MTVFGSYSLLAACAALICLGGLTIAVSSGFFLNLLGAGMLATGGTAAYLIVAAGVDARKQKSI